jgi:serine/threonine protein phosphatase PrpC
MPAHRRQDIYQATQSQETTEEMMKVSIATAKGKRSYQEDRHFHLTTATGTYVGVFDGHGGAECSDYCARRLLQILPETPQVGAALAILNTEVRGYHSGSTASIAFINSDEKTVETAVLGDSPIVVKRSNGSIWASPEHNVRTNKAEAKAAQERGGFVNGGYLFASYSSAGLQMSRALGDAALDRVLLREPEQNIHSINNGGFILVMSDGAVDPAHNYGVTPVDPIADPIADIVSLIDRGADAQGIVDRALAIPTGDNVTAILITL